ncbi:unnamed protein product [Penicillium glandicola]
MASPFTYVYIAFVFLVVVWRWWFSSQGQQSDEPPLVPYRLPWLGHALPFIRNINGYTAWVRSLFPSNSAVTVQIAGRRLYLIFDSRLASLIYRRSRVFLFDPFNLEVMKMVGCTEKDIQIARIGAQTVIRDPRSIDDGRRVLHGLHVLADEHLSGESLDELTSRFIDMLSTELDTRFPPGPMAEWQTFDLAEYVKAAWTHASITALYGSHIYTIWPDIDTWLWEFDQGIQSIITKMPRFLFPKPYTVLEQGLRMFEAWETAAVQHSGFDAEAIWEPFWGHRHTRLRNKHLLDSGLSARGRAANNISLLWGLGANAIPVAMQVMNQVVADRSLLEELREEISRCQTGLVSFDLRKVTAQPKLKSVYLEALRWATASPSPRVISEDCELGGYRLKKNSMVIIHSRTMQMDKPTWEIADHAASNPETFWAGRFLDGDDDAEAERIDERLNAEVAYLADTAGPGDKNTKRTAVEPMSGPRSKDIQQRMMALRPFGGGTTLCPGRHFATNEIIGGLAALMLRLEIQVVEEDLIKNGMPQPDLMKQGGLFPDRSFMVRVRRRHAL